MQSKKANQNLITHNLEDSTLEDNLVDLKNKIITQGDRADTTVAEQLDLLEQLAQFGFGQCLIVNRGITGHWTRHMVLYPKWRKEAPQVEASLTPLNRWFLEKCPAIVASQERFVHFQKLAKGYLQDGMTAVSIPCGLMDDLLTLNLAEMPNTKLIGIDLDNSSFLDVKETAKKYNLEKQTTVIQLDAWKLALENQCDLITSNGLNIYQPDDEKVIELYKRFFKALKPNGMLITSFLTPPPVLSQESSWDMSKLNKEDLRLQKVIIADILSARFQAYRTEKQTIEQLKSAGFKNINIIYDNAKMFPTVYCFK